MKKTFWYGVGRLRSLASDFLRGVVKRPAVSLPPKPAHLTLEDLARLTP